MLILRSLLFNIAFYANLLIWLVLLIPAFPAPRPVFMRAVGLWARSSLWLLKVLAGTKIEVRGGDGILSGGVLVAAKHQSLWETFALLTLFKDPAFILKRELMWIPFFGWYAWKAGSIPIDRSAGSQALVQMTERAREEVARGRQVVIFPEGTRRAPGAPPAYKFGVAHLYQITKVPCLPVALNSGLYWPRRRFIRRPGTIRVEILDPIPPGLPRDTFFKTLQERIETSSDRLHAEGRAELGLAASQPVSSLSGA